MVAPCVTRLNREIDRCSDSSERALLSAELGCYLARIGDLEAAEAIVQELRSQFSDGHDGRVTVMMMSLEGLIMFFREMGGGALDKLKRAQFLSLAFGRNDLIAFTSGWIALIYYNQNRYAECIDALLKAVRSISKEQLAAMTRVSLIIGDLFCYVAQPTSAKIWYEQAHAAATAYGDQATIGALTYNRAALNVHMLRLAATEQTIDPESLSNSHAEVRSALNYQALTATTSLRHLLVGAETSVLMLRGSFDVALTKLEDLLTSGEVPPDYQFSHTLYADRVLCLAKLGRVEDALQAKDAFNAVDFESLAADDQLLIADSLTRAKHELGHRAESWKLPDIDSLRREHQKTLQSIAAALVPFKNIPQTFR